jgi:hypothetical protein
VQTATQNHGTATVGVDFAHAVRMPDLNIALEPLKFMEFSL